MKIKILLMTAILGMLMALDVPAQKAAEKTGVTKFTSVYTNLTTHCKTLRGTNGSDDAGLCKGAGKYQVRVYYSASSSHINVELKGTDDHLNIAILSISFDEKNTKLEWRLANGKPFAVIMRVPTYAEPVGDEQYYGKVNGEKLVVVGLVGFGEKISGEVDAKTAGANAKARELADNAYKALPK